MWTRALWTLVPALLAAAPAQAFSLFPSQSGSAEAALLRAARWADGFGLEDGISVRVDPEVFTTLGVAPDELAAYQAGTIHAFDQWSNAALGFDVSFGDGTTIDPDSGYEIDVIGLPSDDPVWVGNSDFVGLALPSVVRGVERTLANGTTAVGDVITGADIYLNTTTMLELGDILQLSFDDALGGFIRLMMHEIGHVIGLGHPNESVRYDTDGNPFNEMVIDPADPFTDLRIIGAFDPEAIMVARACGGTVLFCEAQAFRELQPDDRGGRDALYPVPEPTWLWLGAAAALLGRRRS